MGYANVALYTQGFLDSKRILYCSLFEGEAYGR